MKNNVLCIMVIVLLLSCENKNKKAIYYNDIAKEYLRSDNYVKALENYNKAFNLDSTIADYYFYNNRGLVACALGDSLTALADWEKAILLDSVAVEARENLCFAYCNAATRIGKAGNLEEAMKMYDKAYAVDSTEAAIYVNRGYIKYLFKDTAGAEEDYLKTITLDSTLSVAYLNMGSLMEDIKEYGSAAYYFAKYIQLEPDDMNGYAKLGNMLYIQKKYKQAIIMIETVRKFMPYNPYPYYYLGMCHKGLDNHTEARKYLEKAKALGYSGADEELKGLS